MIVLILNIILPVLIWVIFLISTYPLVNSLVPGVKLIYFLYPKLKIMNIFLTIALSLSLPFCQRYWSESSIHNYALIYTSTTFSLNISLALEKSFPFAQLLVSPKIVIYVLWTKSNLVYCLCCISIKHLILLI